MYSNKALCRVRTITTFLTLNRHKSSWQQQIQQASNFCNELANRFNTTGYEVQSIRIVTNAFGEYLNTSSLKKAKEDLRYLTNVLNGLNTEGLRIRFAIGEAKTYDEIALLPELIRDFGDLCNACVNVTQDEFGILDNELIRASSQAVEKIAQITPQGEGNFNFTVNFNCEPYIPYFPASYHESHLPNAYVIGLETPDLLLHVLQEFNKTKGDLTHNECFNAYYNRMHKALQYHVNNIKKVIDDVTNNDFEFKGIDSSAAPSKNCASMTQLYEEMGIAYFGAAGSVEVSSLLTKVFKSIKGVPLVGFSGLMLAVTEDVGLARGSVEEEYDVRSLLTYSAVCGIGLDTVPIPGDTSIQKIDALMRDTGTMAFRLNKPLTVRLFPAPNLKAGDMTQFQSDDLCNCAVLDVP